MPDDDRIEALTQACIAAHAAAMSDGSREVQAASRLLLFTLGQQLAKRAPRQQEPGGRPPHLDA